MAAGDSKAYLWVPVQALMRQRYGEENLNRLAPQGATSYCTKNTALFTNFIPNAVAQAFRMRYDSVMPTKTRHGQQGIDQQPTRTVQQPLKTAGVCEGHSNQRRCWVSQRVGISGICSNQACKRWMYRNSGLNSCWHIKRGGCCPHRELKRQSPATGRDKFGAASQEAANQSALVGSALWFLRRKHGEIRLCE